MAVTLVPGIFAWLTSETTPVIDPIAWPNALPEKTTNPNVRISNNDLNLILFLPTGHTSGDRCKKAVQTHLGAIAC
jgi:hypothetical protein